MSVMDIDFGLELKKAYEQGYSEGYHMSKNKEHVNHPSHYNKPGRKECIVEMLENYGKEAVYWFCVCNAYKYEYRAGEKEGQDKAQDLKKAEWYRNYARNLME